MEPKTKPLAHDSLLRAIIALGFWSKESMQNFLESGLPVDVNEAISLDSFCLKDIYRELIDNINDSCPAPFYHQEKVTLSQALKLMEFVPKHFFNWDLFFDIVSVIGQRSGQIGLCKITWEERDHIRGLLGLLPINPVLKNEKTGMRIVFRRTGQCNYGLWSTPPGGYRFATNIEVEGVFIPKEIEKEGIVFLGSSNSPPEFLQNGMIDDVEDVVLFFRHSIFYIPLVKVVE